MPSLNRPVYGREPILTFRTKGPGHIRLVWPSDIWFGSVRHYPVNKTCSFYNMPIKSIQVPTHHHHHHHTPSILRRPVSLQWWTLPVEPCRCPWGRRLDTLFQSNPPASHKGTSWCRHHRNTPGTRRNRGIPPSAVAWEACGCQGHRTMRLLWKRRMMRRSWGWRVCPCPGWGGWRAGRAHSMCPRYRCHGRCHGRTWRVKQEMRGEDGHRDSICPILYQTCS